MCTAEVFVSALGAAQPLCEREACSAKFVAYAGRLACQSLGEPCSTLAVAARVCLLTVAPRNLRES